MAPDSWGTGRGGTSRNQVYDRPTARMLVARNSRNAFSVREFGHIEQIRAHNTIARGSASGSRGIGAICSCRSRAATVAPSAGRIAVTADGGATVRMDRSATRRSTEIWNWPGARRRTSGLSAPGLRIVAFLWNNRNPRTTIWRFPLDGGQVWTFQGPIEKKHPDGAIACSTVPATPYTREPVHRR